ncbi:b330b487-1572-4581-a4c9-53c235eb87d6 [Sclerotinia trifoliorum]|uniref:B330b487-1572-4581-a4c9-53c235eb87d6 n=1 Tax=Sclerotinia trifoliorum TaxID=28548 RepID=A0A8H2VRM5_9HELO|nr:b330b487-1572-4581-a4c9-53c235eb87d6 [Sclerotinia trifoliorum]
MLGVCQPTRKLAKTARYHRHHSTIRFLRDGTKKQKRRRMMTRILKNEIVNLRESEKKLQQHFEGEFTRVVRALQEISFKGLKPGDWVASTNGAVRDDIKGINSAIREWSTGAVNKNAQLLIQDTYLGEHSEVKKGLWQQLAKVMVFTDTELPGRLHPEKADPFFFLGDSSSRLNSFYSISQSWTNEAAHIWRPDTL